MKKVYVIALICLLTSAGMAGDLAGSFKEAVALANAEDNNRATRIYADIDFKDYYQQKYGPIFQSCLMKKNADISPFSFVLAIGADGRVLQIYVDHETNIFACARPMLEKDEFPRPPSTPYYTHISMRFSQ